MKLSNETRTILNDESRIAEQDEQFAILSDLFDGKNNRYLNDHVMTLSGTVGRPQDMWISYTDPEEWARQCIENLAEQVKNQSDFKRFAPPCIEYPIYGVHFVNKLFGAEVFYQDDQWNGRYLTTPIGSLQRPDLEKNETWCLARRAALAFMDAGVKLPLFGTPTLSSALNIAVNLYGGDALMMMLEEPDGIINDMQVINDVIIEIHQWYQKTIPLRQLQPVISWCRTQPPGYGQLCGCTMHLVSGRIYAEIAAPLDDALLGCYPSGGMIHLCGRHTQHIETMRNMKNLRSIQLNDRAALDLEEYFTGLREDQIIYVFPCEEMSVERAIHITGGHRLVICDAIDAPKRG